MNVYANHKRFWSEVRERGFSYREMAEELEHDGLFEPRFPPLNVADFAGDDH